MFERFIRLAEAKGALRKGRFEQAIELAADPLLRAQRRAEEIRDQALAGLMQRAQRRRKGGGLSAALSDVSRILSFEPEFDGARSLKQELEQELREAETTENGAREMLAQARLLAEQGDLSAAEELCASAAELGVLAAEVDSIRKLIEGRRAAALQFVRDAKQALRGSDPRPAVDFIVRARAQHRDPAGADEVARKAAKRWASALVPRLRQLREAGDEAGAYALLARERQAFPELVDVKTLQDFYKDSVSVPVEQLRGLLRAGELEEAVELFRALDPRVVREAPMGDLCGTLERVAQALDLRDSGDFQGAAESLESVGAQLGAKPIGAIGKRLGREAVEVDRALREAREKAAAGQLVEARQGLTPILERWPMHDAVRRELEILDSGARDKEQRLAQARAMARDGRLGEASAQALSLAVPGPQGEEARLLIAEVQARIDLVGRGLDQVRRAIHGRHSGSAEGLRHCLLRLDQLAKVQTDNADVISLRDGVQAELDGVCLLERADAEIAADRPAEAAEHLCQLPPALDRLVRPERLDARCLELADRACQRTEELIAAARLTLGRAWLAALEPVAERFPEVRSRAEALLSAADARQQSAEEAVRLGQEALEARDLESTERHLRDARSAWADGASVLRLEAELRRLHGQRMALDEVEQLTVDKDFDAAHRKLGHMPPTPAALRTRIFDIKQSLAKAQGLDAGFLLRVDEGGEYLVLRSDRITIGNVRDGMSDVAILANIAGRHATVTRSMSFHGGMQDTISAEGGQVFVGGQAVSAHKLKHGDRVRLGTSLGFVYSVPTARSLSAILTLSSGFQVAGTDKILLMRDRGRDGRILIGSSPEAHIRIPREQPEIEIFAAKDGQVRVRFEGKGTLGGRPFRGEHPVVAGSVVTCGEISLVLQPRS